MNIMNRTMWADPKQGKHHHAARIDAHVVFEGEVIPEPWLIGADGQRGDFDENVFRVFRSSQSDKIRDKCKFKRGRNKEG